MQPASQEATFCGCFVQANQQGLAIKITHATQVPSLFSFYYILEGLWQQ